MDISVPISQLFGDEWADGDYSDDDTEGRGFSVSSAREAAQKLANIDMRQYKEKASEMATDLRYAAADGVNKAKEMGSFLTIKMTDKLQELRQKVKESTGIANPVTRRINNTNMIKFMMGSTTSSTLMTANRQECWDFLRTSIKSSGRAKSRPRMRHANRAQPSTSRREKPG